MDTDKKITFTEGPVFSALVRFALPVLGALILQAAYGAVDLWVVGKFGDASSLSAVGTGSSLMHMVTCVVTSLAMGATVIIGQHIGERKPEDSGNAIGTTTVLFSIIAIVLTVILEVFAGDFMQLMKLPMEAYPKAISYVRICSGGVVVIIAYNVISGILRGFGNSKLPFLFVGIACLTNVVFDLLFVAVFHLDAAGAAVATVLAQMVSVITSLFVLRKQKLPVTFAKKQCRIYPGELKFILTIGVPIALQEAMVQISFLVINTVINDMGINESAGYGIAQKLISFIMLIPSAIMQTVSAFVAQNVGAKQRCRAKKGFFTAIITGCSVGVVIFLAGVFGGELMSSFFTKDVAVITQSALYLKGFSVDCILTCVLFSSIGYFNGSGKSIPVMLQGLSSALIIRIPASIFLANMEGASLMYVGLAPPITTVYGIVFFLICFAIYRKRW